tara:strand:+ start:83 stop:571 length:489 start_codon:yes stop_codon:yes gene_type:complete
MGRISKLTDMQKKFVQFLVYGDPKTGEPLNQTEAARLAGYSHDRARQEGAELCNPNLSPLVVAYKRQLEHERLQKHEVTHIGHVSRLNELGRKAEKEKKYQSAIRAEELRGRAGGMYVNQTITKTISANIEEDKKTIERIEGFKKNLKQLNSNHPAMKDKKD